MGKREKEGKAILYSTVDARPAKSLKMAYGHRRQGNRWLL